MSFQIIKAENRVASMIDWFTGICQSITDFVVGSKIRTKFETIAYEMEAQDFAWYQSLKKAIPIAIYQAFDFSLKPAQKAAGEVKFYLPSAASAQITIPAGTKVSNGTSTISTEIVFETTQTGTISIGSTYVIVPITAINDGSAGNIDSYEINTILSTLTDSTVSVVNETPAAGGAERETEIERRLRFIEYVATLSRGTIRSVEYGAKTAMVYDANGDMVESVHDAIVYEPFMHDPTKPVGVFECYIYNGNKATSNELVTAVEDAVNGYYDSNGTPVPGWKAAGVICNVIKATETVLEVTAELTIHSGYDQYVITALAEEQADAYITGLGIGKTFIYNALVERLMGIPGVYNVDITEPASDLTREYNEVFIAGAKTITGVSI